jgi:hypothetical protein
VLQYEARRPSDRVLTITVIDASSRTLREEDRGAADIVIYGFPVARAKREPEPAAAPAATAPAAPAPESTSSDAPAAASAASATETDKTPN